MTEQVKKFFEEILAKKQRGEKLTEGEIYAYRFFIRSKDSGNKIYEISDIVWEQHLPEIADVIRKAGIDTIIVTDRSTALMGTLHGFAEQGFIMRGLDVIERIEKRYGEEAIEKIPGVRFDVR
jgi:hypothetical protein